MRIVTHYKGLHVPTGASMESLFINTKEGKEAAINDCLREIDALKIVNGWNERSTSGWKYWI